METDILAEVIEAEKEIRSHLVAEEEAAALLLARAQEEWEIELKRERQRFAELLAEAENSGTQEGEKRAAATLERARGEANRLNRLDDAYLLSLIARHLGRLVPEKPP